MLTQLQKKWIGPIKARSAKRKSYRRLQELDDRTLRDIGIDRSELLDGGRFHQHRADGK